MPLDFAYVESFIEDYSEAVKILPRHERRRFVEDLHARLGDFLVEFDQFEVDFQSLVDDGLNKSTSFEGLSRFHKKAVEKISEHFLQHASAIDVHDLLHVARDGITIRTLKLVEEEMEREGYGYPPSEYIWVGLGSEGRDEQTIVTDQDNMMIYGEVKEGPAGSLSDYLVESCYGYYRSMGDEGGFERITITEDKVLDYYYTVFSEKIVDRLEQTGFKKCTGNIMPSNPKWRGALDEWKQRLDDRFFLKRGTFEPLDVVIMTDARRITGDRRAFDELMAYFFERLQQSSSIMREFTEAAVLMPTALGFFGNFRVEKTGDHKDMFNLKLHGWAPLIFAVRILALSAGIYEPSTLGRIRKLQEANIIKKDVEKDLIDAYLIFVKFRIMGQIRNKTVKDHMDLNFLKPDMLGAEEKDRLRRAMKAIESLQKYIQSFLLLGETLL